MHSYIFILRQGLFGSRCDITHTYLLHLLLDVEQRNAFQIVYYPTHAGNVRIYV